MTEEKIKEFLESYNFQESLSKENIEPLEYNI